MFDDFRTLLKSTWSCQLVEASCQAARRARCVERPKNAVRCMGWSTGSYGALSASGRRLAVGSVTSCGVTTVTQQIRTCSVPGIPPGEPAPITASRQWMVNRRGPTWIIGNRNSPDLKLAVLTRCIYIQKR